MKNKTIVSVGAVLVSFFIQGFCDIVGISSEYAREAFGWSNTMAGFLPSMVFVWFLFFSVPVGIKMNSWGRKSTVLVGMGVTIVGMFIPLLQASWDSFARASSPSSSPRQCRRSPRRQTSSPDSSSPPWLEEVPPRH